MTDDWPVGSRNFVLISSDLPVGATQIALLDAAVPPRRGDAPTAKDAPAWWQGARRSWPTIRWRCRSTSTPASSSATSARPGRPDAPRGSSTSRSCAPTRSARKIEPGFWTPVEGAGMGRFCDAPEIVTRSTSRGRAARRTASSRAPRCSTSSRQPAARRVPQARRAPHQRVGRQQRLAGRAQQDARLRGAAQAAAARLFSDQIEPVLWWTDEIADAAGLPGGQAGVELPPDDVHRVAARQAARRAATAKDIGGEGAFEGKAAPSNIKDDARRDRRLHRRRGRALRRRGQEARPRGSREGLLPTTRRRSDCGRARPRSRRQ